MKKLSIALLAIALLLPAGMARAWAIYNHVGKVVCLQDRSAMELGGCRNQIPANGKLNGEHGAGLHKMRVVWAHGEACRGTDGYFDIPDGGYARIYEGKVKIYKHNGDRFHHKTPHDCACPNAGPYGAKQK
ncbi:MAG: hypothetical protein KQH53_14465 [Desulfarculaceae bacterium]|nr:hypothetical protein [Desulfarculaceae bacterium]